MMFLFLTFFSTANAVNIKANGPIEYCNVDPTQWDFEPLTEHDIARVHSLKQVHILARHGARILPDSIKTIFPNSDAKFDCHWETVNTRFFNADKDWMSFKLHFVDNEQVVEGNCAVSSSLKQVIPQHRTNAQMARRFYIGEAPYQLMTQSQLNDIAGQLTYYNQLREDTDIPEIKIISANYERTITSATVFMSEFLNINTPDVAMELYIHDFQSDPYSSNKDKKCTKIQKYIDELGMKSKQYKEFMKTELMNITMKQWRDAVGNEYTYDRGEGAVLMYCAGLEVPLSWDTFMNALNSSYAIREANLANKETSETSCKLAASPVNWLFYTMIKNHILYIDEKEMLQREGVTSDRENDDGVNEYLNAERAKLIYHSVHDTTILFVLESLGISNGREPMFAEMLTLEIYERSPSDPWYNKNMEIMTNELYANYLFRWTRKGKALAPFPGCEEEYEYTKSDLCSLSVLMKAMKYGQNIKDWETTCINETETYFAAKDAKKEKKQSDGKFMVENCDKIKKKDQDKKDSIMPFLWTFALGVSFGIGLMMVVSKYNYWFNDWKYQSIN